MGTKTFNSRQVTAKLVEWFCECGGQLVCCSNFGRVIPHPTYQHLPALMYAHRCQHCGVFVDSPSMFPRLAPDEEVFPG